MEIIGYKALVVPIGLVLSYRLEVYSWLAGNLVTWKSKKHKEVARIGAEAMNREMTHLLTWLFKFSSGDL